jgi:Transcriptional Coactivator p15 (PC4)
LFFSKVTLRTVKRAVERILGVPEGAIDADEQVVAAVRLAAEESIKEVLEREGANQEQEDQGIAQAQGGNNKRSAAAPESASKRARTADQPHQQQQQAPAAAPSSGSAGLTANEDGEYVFELAPLVRAKAYKFKKMKLIDIRKYYTDKTGAVKPTGKGISMQVAQWDELKVEFILCVLQSWCSSLFLAVLTQFRSLPERHVLTESNLGHRCRAGLALRKTFGYCYCGCIYHIA